MSELSGKVCVITGAAGNLGQATAQSFVEGGARTVLVDRGRGRLQETYAPLAAPEDYMLAEGVDVSDPGAVTELVSRIVERLGRIEVLVNTVGTYRGGKPVHEEALETWDLLMRANLWTTLVSCRAVIPVMLTGGGGCIVNVAARSALSAGPNSAAYAASKSAVVRLTESLAAEHRTSRIRVNCVLPGTIDTPQNREAMPDADFSRWAAPEAIARAIRFLASDDAAALTGAAVPVG